MMDTVRLLVLFFACFGFISATCTFPNSLQGKWNGGTDATTKKVLSFQFEGDTLRKFNLNVPTLEVADFSCYLNEDNGGKQTYALRATNPIQIFGTYLDLYFCLTVQNDMYSIDTGFNGLLKDKLVAVPRGRDPALNDICNENGNLSEWQNDVSPRFEGRVPKNNIERIVEEIKELTEKDQK